MINLYNQDCMEAMASMKDNEFDLAIVDPPYGIKQHKGISLGKYARKIHKKKNWDNTIPPKKYFDELKRVSKEQIIWGGNYFLDYLHNTRCMIVWDKMNGTNPISDCELAWTSFTTSVRKFSYHHFSGDGVCNRIHPTQKPVALYMWLLSKYATKGMKILDTHLGSGSSAIACDTLGYEFHGYELDEEYYLGAKKRLEQHQRQIKLPLGI